MKNKLQEKFDDFGSIPSNDVWAEIERQLNQKKKKRVLIYWLSSGLAACFLGIILLLNLNRNENTLAGKSKNTILDPFKKTLTLQENEFSKDSLLADKQTSTVSKSTENETNNKKSNSEHKSLRIKTKKINQDNFSTNLGELSPQFEEKNKNDYEVDSSDVVQKQIERKDSLRTQDSLISNENKLTNIPDIIKLDSTPKRKVWSIEFAICTWDAFKNVDQVVTSNSTTTSDPNFENTFWNQNTPNALNSSSSNKSLASIYKPITLNLMANYTTKKRIFISAGFNLDVMKLEENNNFTKYNSLGFSYGLGYQFNLSPKISFVPQIKNNYDFYRFTSSAGKDYSLTNNFSDVSGFQNSLQLDLKFRYEMDKHSSICVSPTNRYYLRQSFENIKLLERKYWYGIQFSYQFHF